MSDIALRVEGLGKRYRIGAEQGGAQRYKSLRDSLTGIARRPIETFRNTVFREPMGDANSFWALKDVDFEVKRGDVVGIIGRNGAGKSTLLKILSRITKPTTGHVTLYGRVGSLLEVGTGFHPELTGRENIYLNGAILGMTRAEVRARFEEIVAFSEVERFLDTPVKHYSSGMYTRLAFAVAAHLEPEVLIVDEVLAVGDAEFQKKCLGKMKDVAAVGRTVLYVSHNMSAIGSLCNRGIVLSHGEVEFSGKSMDATAEYIRSLRIGVAKRAALDSSGYGILCASVRSSDRPDQQSLEPTLGATDDAFIEFRCRSPQGASPILGLTVCSHDRDLPALSASSADSGITIEGGDVVVRVGLPVERLPTGSYRIEAAFSEPGRNYSQSDNLAFFHVVNTVHNRAGTVPRAATLLASSWEVRPTHDAVTPSA
jgi:lipopolysaccharide transport system ATP-binding protein